LRGSSTVCTRRHGARSDSRSPSRHLEGQSREIEVQPGLAPKSATTKIEAAGAGTKVIVDQALADGPVRHWEFSANSRTRSSRGTYKVVAKVVPDTPPTKRAGRVTDRGCFVPVFLDAP
jgi:hypothetical protein